MSYFQPSMSDDGPITHPTQVDPFLSDESVIVGTVAPKRVTCEELAADSPWKRPGQVCAAPVDTEGAAPAPSAAPTATASLPSLLVLAAIGGAAYYLLTRKKRT